MVRGGQANFIELAILHVVGRKENPNFIFLDSAGLARAEIP